MSHYSTAPLLFALKDGHLVGIDDVPNGSRCGCVCPKCGEILLARNGGFGCSIISLILLIPIAWVPQRRLYTYWQKKFCKRREN